MQVVWHLDGVTARLYRKGVWRASLQCALFAWTEGIKGLGAFQGRRRHSGNNSSSNEEERWHQSPNKVIIRCELGCQERLFRKRREDLAVQACLQIRQHECCAAAGVAAPQWASNQMTICQYVCVCVPVLVLYYLSHPRSVFEFLEITTGVSIPAQSCRASDCSWTRGCKLYWLLSI